MPQLTSAYSAKPKPKKTLIGAWQRYKNGFPGKRINIEGENESQKQNRLDKIRHDSWQRKKARGVDDKMLKEITTHNKRLKAEGRLKPKKKAPPAETK